MSPKSIRDEVFSERLNERESYVSNLYSGASF